MTDRSQTVVYTIHHRIASSRFTIDKFLKYVATLKNPKKRKEGRKCNFKVNLLMMQTFRYARKLLFLHGQKE